MERTVYFCENVSQIEFRDGLFFLSDVSGDTTITRAMRPSTFFSCVRGAMELVRQFEAAHDCNIVAIGGAAH
jgi:hypothetical protein